MTLSWDPPANANDAGVDIGGGYQYRYKTDGDYGLWTTVIGDATGSVTVSNLTNGTLHTFQVRALNGRFDTAPEVTATPTAPAVVATTPGPPTNVQAAPGTTSGSVRLSWGPPASDGGAAIDRYQYRYKTTANYGNWSTVNGGGSARSATVTGLANDTPHTFQVRAVNSAGEGPESEVTAVPTADNAAPTFTEGATASRNVEENASSGTVVGNPRPSLRRAQGLLASCLSVPTQVRPDPSAR